MFKSFWSFQLPLKPISALGCIIQHRILLISLLLQSFHIKNAFISLNFSWCSSICIEKLGNFRNFYFLFRQQTN